MYAGSSVIHNNSSISRINEAHHLREVTGLVMLEVIKQHAFQP